MSNIKSLFKVMKDIKTKYDEFKQKYPDAIVIFRRNDWYFLYGSDAEVASKVLGITLQQSIGMFPKQAEFPKHALDIYLPKLVRTGHRIAICDDM